MISIRRKPSALWLILSLFALAIPSVAQESAMELFMAEHHMEMLTADSIDPNHDDLVITALAMQQLTRVSLAPRSAQFQPTVEPAPQPCVLQIDTASDCAELLAMNGRHLADVHFTPVDSTWYMWLSVDPLADKYIHVTPYLYCGDDHSFEHLYKDGVHYVRPGCGRNSNYAQVASLIDARYSLFYRQVSCYSTLDVSADSIMLCARDSAGSEFYRYTFR